MTEMLRTELRCVIGGPLEKRPWPFAGELREGGDHKRRPPERCCPCAKQHVDEHRWLLPAVTLALSTGMQYSKIHTLRWSQIDLVFRRITVRRSKTESGTGRSIPLEEPLGPGHDDDFHLLDGEPPLYDLAHHERAVACVPHVPAVWPQLVVSGPSNTVRHTAHKT